MIGTVPVLIKTVRNMVPDDRKALLKGLLFGES